ncbi:MAG: hypothetical protein E6I90_13150 [Chloroflexi bacterium]|nr:MAG: hypothetical protein E6I90_13150 [Chloroflexota bacterium]
MEDYEEMVSTRLGQPPPSRRRGRRWLLIGGLAFALMLALGVGAIMGSSVSTTQAASVTSGNANSAQTLNDPHDSEYPVHASQQDRCRERYQGWHPD